MRQRAHRPAPPYCVSDAVINCRPVYEAGAVPEGLLTLKQLDKQGRKYAPEQEPAAWLRYILGGTAPRLVSLRQGQARPRAIAPLYDRADSLPKRSCSPEQLAVLRAARDQRKICDHCGETAERPLQPVQMCEDCAARLEVDKALEYLGATGKEFSTRKARQSLAANVSDMLNIKYPSALRLINEIAGIPKPTT